MYLLCNCILITNTFFGNEYNTNNNDTAWVGAKHQKRNKRIAFFSAGDFQAHADPVINQQITANTASGIM